MQTYSTSQIDVSNRRQSPELIGVGCEVKVRLWGQITDYSYLSVLYLWFTHNFYFFNLDDFSKKELLSQGEYDSDIIGIQGVLRGHLARKAKVDQEKAQKPPKPFPYR